MDVFWENVGVLPIRHKSPSIVQQNWPSFPHSCRCCCCCYCCCCCLFGVLQGLDSFWKSAKWTVETNRKQSVRDSRWKIKSERRRHGTRPTPFPPDTMLGGPKPIVGRRRSDLFLPFAEPLEQDTTLYLGEKGSGLGVVDALILFSIYCTHVGLCLYT